MPGDGLAKPVRAALLLLVLGGGACLLEAAPPRIGYVYPAGGRAGTVFEIEVGGQYLGDPSGMVFSGEGIQVKVIDHNKLPSAQVVSDYRDKLRTVQSELKAFSVRSDKPLRELYPEIQDVLATAELTAKNIRQIEQYTRQRNDPKRQLNNQIGESVRLRVMVDPDAEAGARWCRLRTAEGLSNPMQFHIGDLPEFREPKRDEFDLLHYLGISEMPTIRRSDSSVRGSLTLPVTVNGQILPGEVDEFEFEAKEGDQVVVSVEARSLVPYLADAVPGWFQAVVSLRDNRDRELAFSDDYRFNPDPVLFYKIPRDGIYKLRIHDSIYRGREDFVYRVTLGELPFLTNISPLGGQAGDEIDLTLQGGNLAERERKRFQLPEEAGILEIRAAGENGYSNPIAFHVDNVPETMEREDNNRLGKAAELPIPSIVNGVIGEVGDVDYFRVEGKGGRLMTFEVFARRLGSPLDSNLAIFDDDGKQIAWNDDFENPSAGLTTHHADARITIKPPANGKCFVRIGETQNQGSFAHSYRLKVTQGPPDVALRAVPSSLQAVSGGAARVTVHAIRLDGWDGPVRIELKDAPEGYSMRPTTIGAGEESATASISVPASVTEVPVKVELIGYAVEEDRDIATLEVKPAEDMTQAFITKHLVVVDELLIDVRAPAEKPVAANE